MRLPTYLPLLSTLGDTHAVGRERARVVEVTYIPSAWGGRLPTYLVLTLGDKHALGGERARVEVTYIPSACVTTWGEGGYRLYLPTASVTTW